MMMIWVVKRPHTLSPSPSRQSKKQEKPSPGTANIPVAIMRRPSGATGHLPAVAYAKEDALKYPTSTRHFITKISIVFFHIRSHNSRREAHGFRLK